MNKNLRLARVAMIAALYTALCLVFAPISYGPVQVRLAEVLCLLPVLGVDAIFGVTVGCFLSNIIASSPIDAVFGTLATFLAALATYKLRSVRTFGLPILSSLMPVIFNGLIIGAEITFFFMGTPASWAIFFMNMLTVAAGEIISCVILGNLLIKTIEKNKLTHFFK